MTETSHKMIDADPGSAQAGDRRGLADTAGPDDAPPPRARIDLEAITRRYPPDPEAPLRWVRPPTFDPNARDLGLPSFQGAEHRELFRPLPSKAPLDEGGPGVYESTRHGMYNHNIGVAHFRCHLVATWSNHAFDEDPPGGRRLARCGRILDAEGRVDWGVEEDIVELAPAPAAVRRMRKPFSREQVESGYPGGGLLLIGGRLFFHGHLRALHGIISDSARPLVERGEPVPDEDLFFERVREFAPVRRPVYWNLGLEFYQEWDLRDGRLQAVSPIYKVSEYRREIHMSRSLTLPTAELTAPYRAAVPLAQAPADLQELIRSGPRQFFVSRPRYREGTRCLAQDGAHGLSHYAEFERPDGSWVALRDNVRPERQYFYYAAEKATAEAYYPPARRTNLWGSVQPAAGLLPGLGCFIVGNTRNRRNMYLTFSRDGRQFDHSWHLLHIRLHEATPGYAKAQGGSGSGPQYFRPLTAGKSLWLIYSISKERIGATRIPFAAFREMIQGAEGRPAGSGSL